MGTILIVDDEEPIREVLAMIFGDAGHRALTSIHGQQALELVDKDRPDLVFADIMMPVMGGAELCRRLKANADTTAIPVILTSSAGERAAEGTGAEAFIAKPFNLDDVEALVRRWLPDAGARDPTVVELSK
jgi:two-component system phosphate regulon response regulator PhoB